ncbi:hypothetical protein CcaverHIS002_0202000 [Cutaneotrichosporon cavernicola]|uniref:CFA20 domain-containing protein n=1 Tax=Cutaneotrichosporon cavernicola TaxID=279322 RepID=A0AA48I0G2_9TREE|nr:uncharacterized protein CcaverHIS019_0202030 [Cutaneotrichosporon cavernicola]BEI81040.1 hypothetical protein CcaverHIS002_0202000 [Cutaneotrichosporon cavernicola]BEI88841.1 hypothetical protein CcaverHIS019_0202030 [Cutaneotrichosporon cavernicola]BEI96616.1 hypothetical protein CcaverHIS631_0202050 [Cutaneotrichosporon cavernicola]BEJ04388.1 hypothetical protein CcaverHIS641_0202050 [Cutaneotrichosporon cavernicola]
MPTALLAGTVQPPTLTLLSSDNASLPPLWKSQVGPSPKSTVQVLPDMAYPRPEGRSSQHVPKHKRGGNIAGNVVHLQSPMVGDTFIQIGSAEQPLGATLPWLGAQVKALGQRHWALEVTVLDHRGRRGRIRLESGRTEAALLPRSPPLLRLPLATPHDGATEWCEVVVDLRQLVPLFRQLRPEEEEENGKRKRRADLAAMPELFGSVERVRVYPNCRVRRVWLAFEGGVRGEWALKKA